jgi:hypothetical protein
MFERSRDRMMRSEEYTRFFNEEFDYLTAAVRDLLKIEYRRAPGAMKDQLHHPTLAALAFLIGTTIMRISDPADRQDAVERTFGAVRHAVHQGLRDAEEIARHMAQPLH